jgi:2-oxoglutarate ferredoxin oxidoreductase subunit alpha
VGLAEQLQCPAIVLADQYLGQARAVVDAPAKSNGAVERLKAKGNGAGASAGAQAPGTNAAAPADEAAAASSGAAKPVGEAFKRYAITPSGVSPMAIPGTPGTTYTADGLEHNEKGTPSSQASDHLAQMDKRARKLAQLDPGEAWATVEGEGETALVTFGSCTGPAREALARLKAAGEKVRLVSLRMLAPAQPQRLARALEGVKRVLVLEQNHTGQFLKYLRAEYGLPFEVKSLRRPGPLPFRPAEIQGALAQWRPA